MRNRAETKGKECRKKKETGGCGAPHCGAGDSNRKVENRTSFHNDAVCALLGRKLNCDRSAAGYKSSKVGLYGVHRWAS